MDGDTVRTRVRGREGGREGGCILILENCQLLDDIQGFGDYTRGGWDIVV